VALATSGRLFLVVLGSLIAFGPLSLDMYLPAFPRLQAVFGADVSAVQLTMSVFVVGYAIGQFVHGPISDRVGRRPVLMAGIVLYVVTSAACALATSIEALIGLRFLQAFGASVGTVLGRAIIRDLETGPAAARMLSLALMGVSVAALVAPLLGGQVLRFADWDVIFWIQALIGVFAIALAYAMIPETLPVERRRHTPYTHVAHDCLTVLRHRQALAFIFCGALSFATMFAQLSGTPFVYIGIFGVAPENFGWLFAANIIAVMAGSWLNSRLVVRLGLRTMMIAAMLVAFTGGALLLVMAWLDAGGLMGIVIPIVILMSPHNVINANAGAAALEYFPHIAGTASALLGFVRFGMGAISGVAVGLLYDGTAFPMALVVFVCVTLSCAVFFFGTQKAPAD
jgi:DHA1 family bicyclomycin/chloramphenicol resistance-like MFS transporter